MEFVIVTGMSGAGKSTAMKMMEDMGYLCVDNLPVALLSKFVELAFSGDKGAGNVAVTIDIRNLASVREAENILEQMANTGRSYRILFLEADDRTLIKRYKETRRAHPLATDGNIAKGLQKERERLQFLKQQADTIIDTSHLLTRELQQQLKKIFLEGQRFKDLNISIMSFGFKYGIPADADLVFDVRFLPNPYYVEELRHQSGEDEPVHSYVMQAKDAGIFLDKVTDLVDFLMPRYVAEGKNQLVIAIGCTGGRHRSVTLAMELFDVLSRRTEYGFRLEHRDLAKGK